MSGPGRRAKTRAFRALRAALEAKGYDVVDGPRRGWHGQEERETPLPGRADKGAEGEDNGLPPAA